MKDRVFLVGVLALAVALLSSVWLLGSRPEAPAVQAPLPVAAEVNPVADAMPMPITIAVIPTATAASSVALVVALDGLGGARAFAQPNDHVAVFGFIPAELNQGSAMTRVLLPDATVLQSTDDTALTVSVTPAEAVFVRAAQSLGVQMFAALLPADASSTSPVSVSDADLRARLQMAP